MSAPPTYVHRPRGKELLPPANRPLWVPLPSWNCPNEVTGTEDGTASDTQGVLPGQTSHVSLVPYRGVPCLPGPPTKRRRVTRNGVPPTRRATVHESLPPRFGFGEGPDSPVGGAEDVVLERPSDVIGTQVLSGLYSVGEGQVFDQRVEQECSWTLRPLREETSTLCLRVSSPTIPTVVPEGVRVSWWRTEGVVDTHPPPVNTH